MEFGEFDWDESNIEHIARHHVKPEDVEEVALDDDPHLRRSGEIRYLYGQTVSGRYLFTVCVLRQKHIRVVTSRDMDEKERRLYRVWKRKKGG